DHHRALCAQPPESRANAGLARRLTRCVDAERRVLRGPGARRLEPSGAGSDAGSPALGGPRGGGYSGDQALPVSSRQAQDPTLARRLWEVSEEQVHLASTTAP